MMKAAVVENISNKPEQKTSEILELAEAAGYNIAVHFEVKLDPPHPQQYLSESRLERLKSMIEPDDINIIIFSDSVRPHQTYFLEEELDCEIIDKPMLILEIFENKANSRDIKLQVKLAQLKYSMPRLVTKLGESVQSERAGYGGSGEQVTDVLVSDLRNRIQTIEQKIDDIRTQVVNRASEEVPRLPIVGYYSAGKSTLFNILTESTRETGEEAFTTMIMKASRSTIAGYPLDFVDTVGLVDLPTNILSAFDLLLTEIFSFSGMVLCLNTSLPIDRWKAHLADYQEYVNRFTGDTVPRLIIALTKTDLTERDTIQKMRAHLHQQAWLKQIEIIETRSDQPEETRKQFITIFEDLFSDKLTRFFYQNLSPSTASKIHDVARVEDQEWHSNGTTSLSGIGPTNLLNELKGEIFQ